MPKGEGRKLDFAERALRTVEHAIGEHMNGTPLEPAPEDKRNPHAVALGSLGGRKGGKARAKKLTPSRRKAIAKKAAQSRWK
jgi:hypothetical protein